MNLTENQYSALHAVNPSYGRTGLRLRPFIEPLIESAAAHRILDFGCGKGVLGKRLQVSRSLDVHLYDPYVSEFSAMPGDAFDMVLCTDVLEHIPEEALDPLLSEVADYAERAVFVISLTFADQLLPNGDNAHCTIRPKEWWRSRLLARFPIVAEVPTLQDTACCFVTWAVDRKTIARLSAAQKHAIARRLVVNLALRPLKGIALPLKRWVKAEELFDALDGKSVAIVGNSPSLGVQSHGPLIDEHDVVLRMNRGPILSRASHGAKTDILATSIPISSGLVDVRQARFVLWMTPKRARMPVWMFKRNVTYVHPRRESLRLAAKFNARPSTGAMVVELMRLSPASKVSLFGFDGFVTGSLSALQPRTKVPHDFNREQQYINLVAREDSRFEVISMPS